MTDHEHAHHGGGASSEGGFWGSRTFIVWLALLLIGGFLLVSEHRAHILGVGLWLLILACPLLHIFGHGGHGGHGGSVNQQGDSTSSRNETRGDKS
jgi:hypothetical protein